MNKNAEKLVKRFNKIKGERHNWDDHWQECSDRVLPRKSDVYIEPWNRVKGEKKNNPTLLVDSTAVNANVNLAAALHSMLTNPSQKWFELTTGDDERDSEYENALWLESATDLMHNVFNSSNFQTEIHELYLDLGCFGTGVLEVLPDDEKIVRFKSRPIYEVYIEEDATGKVNKIWREFELPLGELSDIFGEESFSESMLKDLKKDPTKKERLLHVICESADAARMDYIMEKGYKKDYVSMYVTTRKPHVIEMKGMNNFPYLTPRWSKLSGEVYGRSPAMSALPDIKLMNQVKSNMIRYNQKATDPPMLIPDDGFGLPVDLRPGGTTYVRAGTQDEIKTIPLLGQPLLTKDIMQDLQQDIRRAFFMDHLQLREGPQKTAQEVMQLSDESQRFMAPQLARQHDELLRPLVDIVLAQMLTRDMFGPIPRELAGREVKVRYTSQIAKAQRASEGNSLMRALELSMPFIEMNPEATDIYNHDEVLRYAGFITGLAAKLYRSPEEVEQIRASRAQQQQLAQQMAENESAANTLNKLGSVQDLPGMEEMAEEIE